MLLGSGLFDLEWYNVVAGASYDRASAVDHYLTTGREQGLSPHPLFDPAHAGASSDDKAAEVDPLADYVRRRDFSAPVHPLFDVSTYLQENPDALEHRDGPLGHYAERGARAGARPNEWYRPDVDAAPRGLLQWVEERRDEWLARQDDAKGSWVHEPPGRLSPGPVLGVGDGARRPVRSGDRDSADPRTTVVLAAEGDATALRRSVASLLAQSAADWELLVVGPPSFVPDLEPDPRVRVVASPGLDRARAADAGLDHARGRVVAWMVEGDEWQPDRLERLTEELERHDAVAAYDIVEVRESAHRTRYAARPVTPGVIRAGGWVDPGVLVVRRDQALRLGGFDESLPAAADHDFFLRLAGSGALRFVPSVGVRRDGRALRKKRRKPPPQEQPWVDQAAVESWHDVVLNRHLVDWSGLEARPQTAGLTTVVTATYMDWAMTVASVHSVVRSAAEHDERVELVVVDNGCGLTAATVLASLPERFAQVTVVHNAVNFGFALGNNVALEQAHGDVVVFLNNDTEVCPGWLGPLRAALEEPDVLGAQSLLVYPDGTVQSAGIAFPAGGGVPHPLLAGFPVEDAAGVGRLELRALTAAALAMRRTDVIALRGFDPVFRNGMEDVDLGLRLRKLRPGHFTVRPDSRVIHHESRSPGRFAKAALNRKLLLDRWGNDLPQDDRELWAACGYDVVGHEQHEQTFADRRLRVPLPVLVRRRPETSEGVPSLRWAIKNPAPTGARGETWGDTHFARRLAEALRELGQEVVVDHRPAMHRESGRFDDVVLVLRGRARYRPTVGQVNLLWLISHPELLGRAECGGYDRVFAASRVWAEETSHRWDMRIDPLLQATDPLLFNPDLAGPGTGDPVLFVGNSRHHERPLVRQAVEAGLPLSVYGGDWEGFVPEQYVRATFLRNDEVGKAYRAAGVVLNDHWEDMRVAGFISNRLFDAAAAGARVVTDDVAGLEGLFGRSVQVARSEADLVRLASSPDPDSIFGDDAERREVATYVHREHSFLARARTLLDAALEARSERGLG